LTRITLAGGSVPVVVAEASMAVATHIADAMTATLACGATLVVDCIRSLARIALATSTVPFVLATAGVVAATG
jgi:CO/xanthine dehydrogenase FAD-binding subunit